MKQPKIQIYKVIMSTMTEEALRTGIFDKFAPKCYTYRGHKPTRMYPETDKVIVKIPTSRKEIVKIQWIFLHKYSARKIVKESRKLHKSQPYPKEVGRWSPDNSPSQYFTKNTSTGMADDELENSIQTFYHHTKSEVRLKI